ncbi:MAG: tetratricopeptide repeat protein [Candidatus Woesearchaeota archaeon]
MFINLLKKYAKQRGFKFLEGKAYHESADPYLPFKKAFKEYIKKEENPLFPKSNGISKKEDVIKGQDSFESERQSVFFEFTDKIRNISKESPLIIFIDDLHWSDKASLNLLNYMIDDLSNSPVFFVTAYRSKSVNEDHPVKYLSSRLSRTHKYNEIRLKPLTMVNVREMLNSVLDLTKIPYDFVETIYNITEGNPLFVEEFIDVLRKKEKLPSDTSNYPTSEEELPMPKIIENMLKQQLNIHLSKDAKKVAEWGSIIGDKIPFNLLLGSLNIEEIRLFDMIDELLELDIWKEIPGEESFTFSNKLMRKIIYDGLAQTKKRKLHNVVAENMVNIYKENLNEYYSDIGYHYDQAEKINKAIDFYIKAGKKAEKVYAHENAIDMYYRAVDLAEKEDKKIDILEKIGKVNKLLGGYEDAIKIFRKIIEKLDNIQKKQEIISELSEIYFSIGELDKSLKRVEEGLSLNDQDDIMNCKLLSVKGRIHLQRREYEKSKHIFSEEKEMAERIQNKKEIAQALHHISTVKINEGNYESALESLNKAVEIREDIDDRIGLSESINNLGIVYKRKGELEKAKQYLERALEIIEEIGKKDSILKTLNNLGILYKNKGKINKALKYHKKSVDIGERIGDKSGTAAALNNIGYIYQLKGDKEEALEYYDKALKIGEEIDDKNRISMSLNNIGSIYENKGELEKALEYYNKSLEIGKDLDNNHSKILVRCGIAEVYLKMGEIDKAIQKAEKALETSRNFEGKKEEGLAHRVLGECYRKNGRFDEAKSELETSLEIFEQINNKEEYYKVNYEMGLLAEKIDGKSNEKEKIRESLGYFEDQGLEWWAEKCRNAL